MRLSGWHWQSNQEGRQRGICKWILVWTGFSERVTKEPSPFTEIYKWQRCLIPVWYTFTGWNPKYNSVLLRQPGTAPYLGWCFSRCFCTGSHTDTGLVNNSCTSQYGTELTTLVRSHIPSNLIIVCFRLSVGVFVPIHVLLQ